jgi:hypothetical protein
MNSNRQNFSADQAVRLRHYQGQRLIAGDLQDEYDNLAWLRRLHVVGLHNTWGIALGFEVSLAQSGILVTPGFAYDCFGREIILSQPRLIAFPAELPNAPDGYNLVMRYDTELGQRQALLDGGLCQPECDHPAFAWQRPEQTRLGQDVPLLRVVLLDGAPAIDLDIRRYTQPLARPHIGNGVTPPTQVWQAWRFRELVFLQTDIDTSTAGFVGAPFYIASLAFDVALVTAARERSLTSSTIEAAGDDPARDLLPYIFTGIASPSFADDELVPPRQPSASGFTFRITLEPTREQGVQGFGDRLMSVNESRQTLAFPFMRVTWLGVEPGDQSTSPLSIMTAMATISELR